MASLLRVEHASFGYEHVSVIRDVELDVEAGAFFGIVGPNGAGKTTLFRGLLGLIRPLAGVVERRTQRIGYVPQRETLDPLYPVSVEEVVYMGAYGGLRGLRGLSSEVRERAAACLDRVGLLDRRRASFASLSGGQRQRALVARALMVQPEMLLLDEPTSGVDRPSEAKILELLLELNRRERIAILLVSHQLDLVRRAVETVLWVADGRVERGPAARMLDPEHLDRLQASGARNAGAE
jgi:ABC-type Mn2+/Zn2+ transport system ATPase subunit